MKEEESIYTNDTDRDQVYVTLRSDIEAVINSFENGQLPDPDIIYEVYSRAIAFVFGTLDLTIKKPSMSDMNRICDVFAGIMQVFKHSWYLNNDDDAKAEALLKAGFTLKVML